MTHTKDTAATELLPLPEPAEWALGNNIYEVKQHNITTDEVIPGQYPLFTAEQMREYALANMNRRAGNACLYDPDDVAFPKGFMPVEFEQSSAESELQEAFASFVAKELSGRVLESGISIIDAATLAFSAGANWQAAWNRRAAPSANGMTLTNQAIIDLATEADLWCERGSVWMAIGGQNELLAFARAIARHLSDKADETDQ